MRDLIYEHVGEGTPDTKTIRRHRWAPEPPPPPPPETRWWGGGWVVKRLRRATGHIFGSVVCQANGTSLKRTS